MSIYFDNAATTPISTEAKAAMVEAMEIFGNPSSTHGEGRKAKAIIETVRKGIAQRLNCLPCRNCLHLRGHRSGQLGAFDGHSGLGYSTLVHFRH